MLVKRYLPFAKGKSVKHLRRGVLLVCSVPMMVAFVGASSPGAKTLVVYTNPVTARGVVSPGYAITAKRHGTCTYGTTALEGSPVPVYSCAVGRSLYLTCWFLKSKHVHTSASALCQVVPWVKTAIEVTTNSMPSAPRGAHQPISLNWPWAVKLTTGVRCVPQPGGGTLFPGKGVVDYYCHPGKEALLGHANRTNALWALESVRQTSKGTFVAGPLVHVSEAWFAGH